MQTKLLDASQPGAIEHAADLLRNGHLVAFPTDTLYGVGANPLDPVAVERLYQVKRRPADKGIPILLADVEDLAQVVSDVPIRAQTLIERYWPGPITLILPKGPDLVPQISPNEGIAVRIPDSGIARQFIRAAGGAVATSSANRSGQQPASDARDVMDALRGSIAAVLDGGPVHHGVGSTILDCLSSPPRLLREGPIGAENLFLAASNTS